MCNINIVSFGKSMKWNNNPEHHSAQWFKSQSVIIYCGLVTSERHIFKCVCGVKMGNGNLESGAFFSTSWELQAHWTSFWKASELWLLLTSHPISLDIASIFAGFCSCLSNSTGFTAGIGSPPTDTKTNKLNEFGHINSIFFGMSNIHALRLLKLFDLNYFSSNFWVRPCPT